MRDHQQFEETILPNGIRVYTYTDSFPISCMELQLPIGSGHAIEANGFLAGSPHFLEHTQLIRSKEHPEPYALDRLLGLRSGNSNASTHTKATTHWIDTPENEQEFGISSLIDRIFHPIFHEDDLAVERTVIRNERDKNTFYPGKNPASHYFFSEFIDDIPYPVEQIFGTNEDLERLSVSRIQEMHQQVTTSDQIIALAVGNSNFDTLKDQLAALPTVKTDFQTNIKPTTWGHKEFHTKHFDTIPQPHLEIAWLHARPTHKEYLGICFFINLLTDSTQGPLHKEFREEKGWAYNLESNHLLREETLMMGLTFPVNTLDQVEYIRKVLPERISTAGKNQQLVEDEITRQIGSQVYYYQTAGSIISSASRQILAHGKIYTEKEYQEALIAMKDPTWRTHIIETFFSEKELGSLCMMPERRTRR